MNRERNEREVEGWRPATKIPVSVLGATGTVGQRFVRRLADHPWFELRHLAASEKSTGKRFSEACSWRLALHGEDEHYAGRGAQVLVPCTPEAAAAPLVFSALDSAAARELEPRFAEAGCLVFSNASAYRMEADVPLLIPEVNAEHLALLEAQRRRTGWSGGIVCNPNCTATILSVALAPLERAFGIEQVLVTSMQALSGAGHPGVPSLDATGNVVPFIREEEDKMATEPQKMLGALRGGAIELAPFLVSALCHRVPVVDGHTEAVSVKLRGAPSPEAVRKALATWRPAATHGLPSAPRATLRIHDAEDRPQARLDVESERGMTVHVGRIRACAVLGVKFVLLGHNAERGAAGASVLNAELAVREGHLS
ncbi:MAG: aspartate-semialdehyde dehydrogenase [Planctomycetes bacterium]|nr:aspartate-semialdehyde dehydrogenase [Planctomycetota bacterium]